MGASRAGGSVIVERAAGDVGADANRPPVVARPSYDGSPWNLSFGVYNHLVLLTAVALFVIYLIAALLLFVWRWRGCLVRIAYKCCCCKTKNNKKLSCRQGRSGDGTTW